MLIPKAGSGSQAEKASLTLVIRSHLKAMNINSKNCMSPMPLGQNKLHTEHRVHEPVKGDISFCPKGETQHSHFSGDR